MIRNPSAHRQLLTVSAVVECLAGLALLLVPGTTIDLVLGAGPDRVGLMIGRVAGVALLALGIACWGARTDSGGPARAGTLRAITLYNLGAGLLLVLFAATGQASGLVVWGAGLFHLGLGAAFAASPRCAGGSSPARSGI
jgi:hypothetical protein